LNQILLYWHTIRYLRPSQIYGRLIYSFIRPRPDFSPAPQIREKKKAWIISRHHKPTLIGPCNFQYLNQTGILDEIGWTGSARSSLWRYNQHYFNDLNAIDSQFRKNWHLEILDDWLENNPPGSAIAWDPYPTSLRLVNCVKWVMAGNKLPDEHLDSLATQTRWLSKRLETHILGNHLLTNAKALIFMGLFFEGDEALQWFEKGVKILEIELIEQILSDGGHFELSPMYHRIVLEDLLDLINLFQVFFPESNMEILKQLITSSKRMFNWMDLMSHPDGEVTFFNDSAMAIAAPETSLKAYAELLSLKNFEMNRRPHLLMKESGFFRWEEGDAVLIGDVGDVGPDYIPGHGHADTLSFELSIGNSRVLVNSGTSLYEESPERLRQRGTSSHNTLEIDGENSSEIWKSFRVARRAQPFDLKINKKSGKWLELACSHNGYKRLEGNNIHRRSWKLSTGKLVVCDEVFGEFKSAIARYYLHPDILIEDQVLVLPDGHNLSFTAYGGNINIVDTKWTPEFGLSFSNQCIELHLVKSICSLEFEWN